jgi:hypothetical protein
MNNYKDEIMVLEWIVSWWKLATDHNLKEMRISEIVKLVFVLL